MRPRLLDLYCAGGGASVGYHRAGFQVVGVDILPQSRYPYWFIRGDALTFLERRGHEFDVIAASPPCHLNSTLKAVLPDDHRHRHMIRSTRNLLEALGKPYVIENVPGAALVNPLMLCGSMFGLGTVCEDGRYRQLRRHRMFESNVQLTAPSPCRHEGEAIGVHGGGPQVRDPAERAIRGGYQGRAAERRRAMGIGWLYRDQLSLAIPPAYTQHIGAQLLANLDTKPVTS